MSTPAKSKRQKRLEQEIKRHLHSYSISQWLLAIVHQATANPLEKAAATHFVMLYARPDEPRSELPRLMISTKTANRLIGACMRYRLADPISSRRIAKSGSRAVMRRIAASQIHYGFDPSHAFARAFCLWVVLAPKISKDRKLKFDFATAFTAAHGVSARDWLKVAMTISAASTSNKTLSRGYFDIARSDGIELPKDSTVLTALRTIAATPGQFREYASNCVRPDRSYFAYDRDPLLQYPVCRLWEPESELPEDDKLALTVPTLLAHRVTSGVRDSLKRQFGDLFSNYFGDLFGAYVGELLKNCRPDLTIYTEAELGRIVGARTKRPDWLLRAPDCTISFECKAAKLDPSVEMTGDLTDSTVRRHVEKAARQFVEFEDALPPNHDFASSERWRIIVTWDDLYMGRDELSRDFGVDMFALPINKVEVLIGLMEVGEDPQVLMQEVGQHGIDAALDNAIKRSEYCHGKTYLSRYSAMIFESLGF